MRRRRTETIGPARCMQLIRGVTSYSIEERDAWADIAGEWVLDGEIDTEEIQLIATALAWAALIEIDRPRVRAGLLSSLSIMGGDGLLPTRTLELVTCGIPQRDLHPVEVEGYCYLTAMLSEQSVRDRPDLGERRTVGALRCVDLLRGVSSDVREDRHDWAPTAGEWLAAGELDAHEADAVAAALVRATVLEPGGYGVHVGLLGSLGALARAGALHHEVLRATLAAVRLDDLGPAERDTHRELVATVRGPRAHADRRSRAGR